MQCASRVEPHSPDQTTVALSLSDDVSLRLKHRAATRLAARAGYALTIP